MNNTTKQFNNKQQENNYSNWLVESEKKNSRRMHKQFRNQRKARKTIWEGV